MLAQEGLPAGFDGQPLAWEDKTPSSYGQDVEVGDRQPVSELERQSVASTSGREAVWQDPDDLTAQVNIATQPRLRKLRQTEQDTVVSGTPRCCHCLWEQHKIVFISMQLAVVTSPCMLQQVQCSDPMTKVHQTSAK